MSDSRARSSIFSRATTGMFLSPSCNEVTATPLIALVAEFATSMFVIPARFARSGSTFRLTWALSFSHSFRTRAAAGRRPQHRLHLRGDLPHRPDVLRAARGTHVGPADDPNLHRIVHRIGLQLPQINSRARNCRRQHRLHLIDKLRSDLLLVQLDQHFGIVQLLRLAATAKTRTADCPLPPTSLRSAVFARACRPCPDAACPTAPPADE